MGAGDGVPVPRQRSINDRIPRFQIQRGEVPNSRGRDLSGAARSWKRKRALLCAHRIADLRRFDAIVIRCGDHQLNGTLRGAIDVHTGPGDLHFRRVIWLSCGSESLSSC